MPVIPNMVQNNGSCKKNKAFTILSLFYQIIFILSGLNHSFFKYNIIPVKLFKLYSFILCVIFNVIVFISSDLSIEYFFRFWWSVLIVTKYNLYIIFLIFSTDSSLFNLLKDLFLIDSKSGINSASFNLELKILCSNFAWICLRLGASFIISCLILKVCTDIVFMIKICILSISSEVFILTYTFMFYALYSRFKQFIITLKKVESDFLSHQRVYKQYVETIEKYKKAFDPVIMITLCCEIPDIMINLYFSLKEWRYHTLNMNFTALTVPCIFILLMLIITLLPAVIAGMLSSQAQIIIWILHDKLMQERDERSVWEIQRFIRYVEARNCQFRVYRVIPLDARLVGMVASFCVTYIIVIIQFAKLY